MLYIQILFFAIYVVYNNGFLGMPFIPCIRRTILQEKNNSAELYNHLETDMWIDGELPWIFSGFDENNTTPKLVII